MNVKFRHETPQTSDCIVHQFVSSKVEEIKEDVYNSKGSVVKQITVKRPVKCVIPPSEFENRDLDCALFSVENLKQSGVDLFKQQPITRPLFENDLDARASAVEQLDNFDYDSLNEKDFE